MKMRSEWLRIILIEHLIYTKTLNKNRQLRFLLTEAE
jgi:hypothetical protein